MHVIQQQTQAIQEAVSNVAESTSTMLSRVANELARQSSTLAKLATQEAQGPPSPDLEQPEAEGEPTAQSAVEMDQEPIPAERVVAPVIEENNNMDVEDTCAAAAQAEENSEMTESISFELVD